MALPLGSDDDPRARLTGSRDLARVRSPDELLEAAALHLALLAVPGIGTVKAVERLESHGGIAGVAAADDDVGAALRRHVAAARSSVDRAAALGLAVVPLEHPAYPPALLQNVMGPPTVLFVQGALPAALRASAHELRSCAVVGTRRPSRYSLDLAAAVARSLAGHDVLVVSGLALGVDAAAHQGALTGASHGTAPATMAVLGGGHRHLHPAGHAHLAERIVEQGGAVISEWPPDTPPARHHFLRRNRVISGLARCVLVVEAARRSGALSTAAHAVDQGRHLLVVPGRPDDPRYAGNLELLRDGAAIVVEPADVLLAFGIAEAAADGPPAAVAPRASVVWSSPLPAIELGPLAVVVRGLLAGEAEVSVDAMLARLHGGATAGVGVAPADAASTATPTSTADLTALLTTMELVGEVEQTPSGRYRLRRLSAAVV